MNTIASTLGLQSDAADEERRDYLIFRIGGEYFAVAALSLRQILEPPEIVTVPNSPSQLLGIINLRGEILAVLDLRVLFELGTASSEDDERLVVLKFGRRSVALIADEVLSIETMRRDDLEPVPMDLPEIHRRTFLGQLRLESGVTVSIMDPTAIFTLPHYQVDTKGGGASRHHG